MAKVKFMFNIIHENSPFLSDFSFSRKMYFKTENKSAENKKTGFLDSTNKTENLSRTFAGYCKYEALRYAQDYTQLDESRLQLVS